MLDPILRLSVSRQQGSYYVHAIGRAVPTIHGAVVNDGADLVPTRDLFHERDDMMPYGGLRYSHERFHEPQAV
jgi:hypothetical protein